MAGGLRQRRPQSTKKAQADAAAEPPSSGSTPHPTPAEDARPPAWKVWLLASRPHTLTASLAPNLVGTALAYKAIAASEEPDQPHLSPPVLTVGVASATFACLIQLGTNLHNDYADFVKGADDHTRIGHSRATQKGWLTPRQTAGGATLCLAVALVIGIWLARLVGDVADAVSPSMDGVGEKGLLWCDADVVRGAALDWACEALAGYDTTTLVVVVTSVFNAVAYTGGPYPLGYLGLGWVSIGYSGLGDLFVFLYFGLVATLMVPYLCLRLGGNVESISDLLANNPPFQASFIAALPVGWIATAIIVVNNLRDRSTDVKAGKRTLAVRFGAIFCRMEYLSLIILSYFVLFALAPVYGVGWLLALLSMPIAHRCLEAVAFGEKDLSELNPFVGRTALVQIAYCTLLSVGILLSPVPSLLFTRIQDSSRSGNLVSSDAG